jgi:hypothetical protein
MKDERSIKALNVAEAFANGNASARDLAFAYAAARAARAAADAAYAAAYADAYADAYAQIKELLRICGEQA